MNEHDQELRENELALVAQETMQQALTVARPPEIVLQEAKRAAQALQQVIAGKPKKIMFGGKQYVESDDWALIGRFYGATSKIVDTHFVEFGEVKGFEATADVILVSTGQVISSAQAMCLSDEKNWSSKPLFQLKSMAQTRACAKALRNVFSWVVVLAGYAPTPAEEMDGMADYKVNRGKQQVVDGDAGKKITTPQLKRMFAISREAGRDEANVHSVIERFGFHSTKDVLVSQYEKICEALAKPMDMNEAKAGNNELMEKAMESKRLLIVDMMKDDCFTEAEREQARERLPHWTMDRLTDVIARMEDRIKEASQAKEAIENYSPF